MMQAHEDVLLPAQRERRERREMVYDLNQTQEGRSTICVDDGENCLSTMVQHGTIYHTKAKYFLLVWEVCQAHGWPVISEHRTRGAICSLEDMLAQKAVSHGQW